MILQITENISLLLLMPLAYLLGSIPSAVWIGKIFHDIDVREHGSGNAGATNVMRVLGIKTGVPVLLIDMFKGWISVFGLHFFKNIQQDQEYFMLLSIFCGIFAVIGHILPVFAGFRGGKGVATIAGVCLALHPLATLSSLAVFVFILLIWKYVSLASIGAGTSFPIWVILVYKTAYISLSIFSIIAAILLIFTHRKNIERLLKKQEAKAGFLFKKRE
jgi:glycerol-3-phosphate acyltransferase PlsY